MANNPDGSYQYPLIRYNVTVPNTPAPERAHGERTGDPFLGGSLPTEARSKGIQPGFDIGGVPLAGATRAILERMSGPQTG